MDKNAKIIFDKLEIGDKFIAFPFSGDNNGHGGFNGTYYIFMKIYIPDALYNAVKLSTGVLSVMHESMLVLKVG